jgi:hypothetical protein
LTNIEWLEAVQSMLIKSAMALGSHPILMLTNLRLLYILAETSLTNPKLLEPTAVRHKVFLHSISSISFDKDDGRMILEIDSNNSYYHVDLVIPSARCVEVYFFNLILNF